VTDDELWSAFCDQALPAAQWTHRAHVRIAWMFGRRHALDEAHLLMRAGIIRLNASHGLVESATRGYHETITRAWLAIVQHLITRDHDTTDSSSEFVERYADDLDASVLVRHYSKERLMSTHARAMFVEPDLVPLPLSEVRTRRIGTS